MGNYIAFSSFMDPAWWTPNFWGLTYFQIAISALILAHSVYINWNKRKKYTFTRRAAEVAAATGLIAGVLTIICDKHPTPVVMTLVYDVLLSAGCSFFVQICDNFIVLERTKAIRNVPKWEDWLVKLFIGLVLFVPWWPVYWLIPFFCNVNEGNMTEFPVYGNKICCIGNIFFNAYYTFRFSRTLYLVSSKATSTDTRQTKRVKIIAIKSIIHCCTSCFANIWADFVQLPDISSGFTIYSIIIIIGLHFLFNFKIENLLLGATNAKRLQTNASSAVPGSQVKGEKAKLSSSYWKPRKIEVVPKFSSTSKATP